MKLEMPWKSEIRNVLLIVGLFVLAYHLPVDSPHLTPAIDAALYLVKWYAREHVLLCLVPAFFIAGLIAVFVSQSAVLKYFGAGAKKWLSYSVSAVSGSILAVCSCTILPLFSGIHKRGAGLGPAIAFLYSGPAINIMAIILTARVLGFELGVARVIGAVVFAVVIGLAMHGIYRKEEASKSAQQFSLPEEPDGIPAWFTAFLLFILVGILVFATWGEPNTRDGIWHLIYNNKWYIVSLFGVVFAFSLTFYLEVKALHVISSSAIVLFLAVLFPDNFVIAFSAAVIATSILISITPGKPQEWMQSTWGFAKQIMPLLGLGVLIAGFLLGAPDGSKGIIPDNWIASMVGGNSISANFFASIVGAFMYFATLTEVPILQGLIGSGMGKGPALALLLAGPALSLPNMLVIRSVIGTQKTIVYVALVVVMATISGLSYGSLF